MPRVKLFDEQEVLTKAMQLFWANGYHATSVQNLVDHLGINRASIYDTFGGKKELFDKSFCHYRKINVERVSNFLEAQKNVKTGFRKLFESAIDETINDKYRKGCFTVNSTTELVPKDKELQKLLKQNKKTFEQIFYNFLLKGEKKGEIGKGKDLNAIATLLFTFNNGLQVVAKVEKNKAQLMTSVDAVLQVLD